MVIRNGDYKWTLTMYMNYGERKWSLKMQHIQLREKLVMSKVDCRCRLERPAPNEVFDFFVVFRGLVFVPSVSGSKRLVCSLGLLLGRSCLLLGLSSFFAFSIAVFQALAASTATKDCSIQYRGQ